MNSFFKSLDWSIFGNIHTDSLVIETLYIESDEVWASKNSKNYENGGIIFNLSILQSFIVEIHGKDSWTVKKF